MAPRVTRRLWGRGSGLGSYGHYREGGACMVIAPLEAQVGQAMQWRAGSWGSETAETADNGGGAQ